MLMCYPTFIERKQNILHFLRHHLFLGINKLGFAFFRGAVGIGLFIDYFAIVSYVSKTTVISASKRTFVPVTELLG